MDEADEADYAALDASIAAAEADAEEDDAEEETSFIDPVPIDAEPGAKIVPLRQENLQSAVDDYYVAMKPRRREKCHSARIPQISCLSIKNFG